MSTKIYDAYKVKDMTLFDLLKYFQKMKNEILQYYANNMIVDFDKLQLDKGSETIDFVDVSKILEISDNMNTDNPYDTRKIYVVSSVVIYPHRNGDLYVHFFNVKNNIMKKYIINNQHFEDFHYQNSSDMSNFNMKKENINTMTSERREELERDWNYRREVWDELLSGLAIPSENGFIFEFTDKEKISITILNKNLDKYLKWTKSKKLN